MKKNTIVKLVASAGLLAMAGTTSAQYAQLEGDGPTSACECYEKAYQFGTYNMTPANQPMAETTRFKCGLKGWKQAFNEGHREGLKTYRFSKGDYSQGAGEGLCPYNDY
ncbi:MAG: hypothetical protein COA84_05925 [Robiginitomaculum sp.]|nr:MAG: hypothetical protein COA84_05925 [Robiginitomaculum sp.]